MEWENMPPEMYDLPDGCKLATVTPLVISNTGHKLFRWSEEKGCWQRAVQKPEPQFYIQMEYQYQLDTLVPWRIGPVPKQLAESMAQNYRGSSYHRNVRIVEAAP